MIKVSVVVPVYNVEKYLRKCLESLAEQTLHDIEIIVVNDGSQDNSQDIIDDFVEKYPNKFVSLVKENGGLSDARNYGMQYCLGEYIGFVDSDDYVDPEMYEEMYEEAKSTNADLVVCDYLKEYPTGSQLISAKKYSSSKDMFLGGLAAAWNKIYRKALIEKSGLLFPKGLIYEDTEFFCELIPHVVKCGYVNKPFVHYVQREGSIMNTQGEKVGMIFEVFDNIFSYYRREKFIDKYKDELTYFTVRVLLGSSMERICRCRERKQRNELLDKTIRYMDDNLKAWRRNCYLSGWKSVRNIYMKHIYGWNVKFVAAVLHYYFLGEDKKLFRD